MPTKVRIIPTLLHKNVGLVKGIGFDSWRRVGSAMQTIKVYNIREVDEMIFVDITATLEGRAPDFDTIDDLADECFMPLTVGGGIRNVENVYELLRVGADKVCVNTAAVESPSLIRQIAYRFGSQCVVASIDAVEAADSGWEAVTRSGTQHTGKDVVELACELEASGAGEILLTSITRDGTMSGYDLGLTEAVCNVVTIPVIASGGAGNYQHMAEALGAGASAVAAASIFHFTQQTPLEAKDYLRSKGFPVRS